MPGLCCCRAEITVELPGGLGDGLRGSGRSSGLWGAFDTRLRTEVCPSPLEQPSLAAPVCAGGFVGG